MTEYQNQRYIIQDYVSAVLKQETAVKQKQAFYDLYQQMSTQEKINMLSSIGYDEAAAALERDKGKTGDDAVELYAAEKDLFITQITKDYLTAETQIDSQGQSWHSNFWNCMQKAYEQPVQTLCTTKSEDFIQRLKGQVSALQGLSNNIDAAVAQQKQQNQAYVR